MTVRLASCVAFFLIDPFTKHWVNKTAKAMKTRASFVILALRKVCWTGTGEVRVFNFMRKYENERPLRSHWSRMTHEP